MANKIHSTAVIEGDVELGEGNEIGPYSVLYGPLVIGDDNYIAPHVIIGTPGQDTRNPRYDSSRSRVEIGSRNIIREYTAIQKPCYRDVTKIGNDIFLMQSVHIPHDAILHDQVVVTPMVVFGGIVEVLRGANLGIGCSVHQYSVIGHYSIVGMGSSLIKNLPPFSKFVPGKPLSVNSYAINKYGFQHLADEIEHYVMAGTVPISQELKQIVDEFNALSDKSGRAQY